LREFLGVDAELDFLDGIASGAFTLEVFTPVDLERCQELISTYRDLDLGLADSAVMATAERLKIDRLLTVDERDFRAVRPKHRPFVLLPSDVQKLP
jgi:predicted nucleic acid-binding protein